MRRGSRWGAIDGADEGNLDRIAAAGFDIRIAKLDVRLPDGTGNLAAQATIYPNTMEACRAERCKAVAVWGVTDKYSWISSHFVWDAG